MTPPTTQQRYEVIKSEIAGPEIIKKELLLQSMA